MRQISLAKDDTVIQLQETLEPRALRDFLHQNGGRAQLHKAAAELSDFGDVDIYICGRRVDQHLYTLELEIDVSKNRAAVRNLGIATIGARVQRFFGYDPQMAPAVGAASGSPKPEEPPKADSMAQDGPPASALGDFYRALGHAFGLLADYATAAVVGAAVGIKRWAKG